MKFRQIVENALAKVYLTYDDKLDPNIPQKWTTIHKWYEERYLNPDSPERTRLYE